jgi:NADH-dependent peroxiredoxin subunit F
MYELIIIGAGPAGITAFLYATSQRIKTLVISKDIGGKAVHSYEIENYIGYQIISGIELMGKFEQQLKYLNLEQLDDEVIKLTSISGHFGVYTADGENFQAKAVIIASGMSHRFLDVPGEARLRRRGVSDCATCDGALFPDMDVAIIGGGNSGLQAASILVKVARRVYLISRGAWEGDQIYKDKLNSAKNLIALVGYDAQEIKGERMVEGIVLKSRSTGDIRQLLVGGVFIEIGFVPNIDFTADLVKLNSKGEIVVDSRCATSIPGVFAAGDVTNSVEKQIIVAAGEGAKAALSANRYLRGND